MPTCKGGAIRRTLLILALAQLLTSVAVPPLFGLATGAAKLSALDKYWGLKQEGVIDDAKLAKLQGGRFTDWAEVPYYLTDKFQLVGNVAYGVSVVCFITSVSLFAVWWRTRGAFDGDSSTELPES